MATTYPTPGLEPRTNSSFAKPKFDMEERKEPTFIKFTDGELIEGELMNVERIAVNQKPATRYTVRNLDDGEIFSFLGTYQIDSKIHVEDVGKFISVRCEGEDSTVSRNGNNMKIFRVAVSKQKVRQVVGRREGGDPGITDDDIPF